MLTKLKTTRFGNFLCQQRFLYQHSPEISFYRQFVANGDLVFDVGANVGDKATVFRSLGARVICFEPQPAMCRALAHRFRHDSKVIIEPVALGENTGHGTIRICTNLPEISTLAESSLTKGRFAQKLRDASAQVVQVVAIEEMINKHGLPRFCKIDVEGFELQVLRGLRSRIPTMSLEVNIEFIWEIKQCIEHLQELGLVMFNFSSADTNRFAFQRWLNCGEMANFLESQNDSLFWGDLYARVA